MLDYFTHITIPRFTGNIECDVKSLLYANGKQNTYNHVEVVAKANTEIARRYNIDPRICELCGYLHDVSAVVAEEDMALYAVDNGWCIDESERKYPMLLHQRISRIIAARDFGITDERILSAVECHTTLKVNASDYDMALFIADKLAWDQEGEAPFYAVVSDRLNISLESAALAYMDYITEHKIILHPHRWFEEAARYLRAVV